MIRIATARSAISDDVRNNGAHLRGLMERAAAAGARLVHFPEGALSGYAKAQIHDWEAVDWEAVEEELSTLATLAHRLGLWVAVGCAHRLDPPHRPHNSLWILSDQGAVAGRYHKRFCSNGELKGWYTPGMDPLLFEVDGYRFGCALCIEVCFPHLFAEYERLGADAVLLSAYSDDPIHGVMARAHAATTGCWISLSTVAEGTRLPSAILGPDGGIVAESALNAGPDPLVATLDRDAPAYEVALRRARPWRAQARAGDIYGGKRP